VVCISIPEERPGVLSDAQSNYDHLSLLHLFQSSFWQDCVQSQKMLGSTQIPISSLPSSLGTFSTWSVSMGNDLDTQHKHEMELGLFAGGIYFLEKGC